GKSGQKGEPNARFAVASDWYPGRSRRWAERSASARGRPQTEAIQMNALTRWDPFRELHSMHNRLSTLFDRPSLRRDEQTEWIGESEWSPMVDVSEDDKHYTVKVELPEMKREDIKVNLENGVLSISGERKFEKEDKNKKYHRVERAYG